MTVICTRCGSTNVTCEAYINPNTKAFDHFTDDAFDYGWCEDCRQGVVLTDTPKVQTEIQKAYSEYVRLNGKTPHYVKCEIVWSNTYKKSEDVKILLSEEFLEDKSFLHYCSTLDELLKLAAYGTRDFIVTAVYGFDLLTKDEQFALRKFEFEIMGRKIPITGKEVLDFIPKEYTSGGEEVQEHLIRRICLKRYYREKEIPFLNKFLVWKLMDRDERMREGEKACFKLQLEFLWYIEVEKRGNYLFKPYSYILKGDCLDKVIGADGVFPSMEKALLHCLNRLNDNANIPNRYKSIRKYLGKEYPLEEIQ